MSKRIGKFTTVSVDDSGGTARDITNDVDSIDGLGATYDEVEQGGFSQDKFYRPARGDAPLTIEGFSNPTATTGAHIVLSGIAGVQSATFTVTVAVGANLAPTTGDPEWEGEFYCTEYKATPDLNGMFKFSAKLVPASSTLPAWGTKS